MKPPRTQHNTEMTQNMTVYSSKLLFLVLFKTNNYIFYLFILLRRHSTASLLLDKELN